MYYTLIGISAIMFGLQFFFQEGYQKREGTGMNTAILFSLGVAVVTVIAMFAICRTVEFSWFSCLMAFLSALIGIGFLYCSALAFGKVNLSVYSLFSMLGGMLLPAIAGICFFGEKLTLGQGFCILAIIAALMIGTDQKADRKTLCYCLLIFFLNGMAGVVSKWHQSYPEQAISSSGFMLLKSLITIGLCGALLFGMRKKRTKLQNPGAAILSMTGYGLMTGIANFLILVALLHVNASVQYPMITGGTIVISTALGIIQKEQITKRNLLAAGIALLGTVMIAVF